MQSLNVHFPVFLTVPRACVACGAALEVVVGACDETLVAILEVVIGLAAVAGCGEVVGVEGGVDVVVVEVGAADEEVVVTVFLYISNRLAAPQNSNLFPLQVILLQSF